MTQELSKEGLGASEIAAVCGLNRYSSRWNVYQSRIGEAPFTGNERTEWGHRLEPAIRQKYADSTGYTVAIPARSLFHPDHAWMRATPDGMVYEAGELTRLFQAKSTGEWMGKEWDEHPPEHVQLQEQWEMGVTGAPVADICVLIGNWDWRMYTIARDDAMIADLMEIGHRFVLDTAAGIKPSVDDSEACKAHLKRRLKANAIQWTADEDGEARIAEWKRLHTAKKALDSQLKLAQNMVRELFVSAECESIAWSDGVIKVRAGYEKRDTSWEHVARLVASASGMSPSAFEALVESTTKIVPVAPTISAPQKWGKHE